MPIIHRNSRVIYMNRGFVSIMLMVAALVVVAAGAGGWWYVSQASEPSEASFPTLQENTNTEIQAAAKPSAPTPKPPVQPSPTPVANNKTANWKTYRNESYGFEFKYPTGYATKGVEEELDPPSLRSTWPTLAGFLTLSKVVDPNREGAESVILRIFSNPEKKGSLLAKQKKSENLSKRPLRKYFNILSPMLSK